MPSGQAESAEFAEKRRGRKAEPSTAASKKRGSVGMTVLELGEEWRKAKG